MSLITLNSNGQSPHLFTNHFPQPIKIPPNSQVCLLKFLHFRDSSVYNVTSSNNILRFVIGNTNFDALRLVLLTEGQYSGAEFATQLALQMNNVLQQQNYQFSVTFVTEDPTTSPPTPEGFIIVVTTLATPEESAFENMLLGSADVVATVGTHTTLLNVLTGADPAGSVLANNSFTAIEPKGILTDDGNFTIDNIGFNWSNFYDITPDGATGLNNAWFGICRDELANLNNETSAAKFDPNLQDVSVYCSGEGIEVSSITINGGTQLGNPGYASKRVMRTLPKQLLTTLITNETGGIENIPNARFKIVITAKGTARKFIAQLFISLNLGSTYTAVAADAGGNDTRNNPYFITHVANDAVSYNGVFWVSNLSANNDTAAATKPNMLQTRKAPFKPTATIREITSFLKQANLTGAGTGVYLTSADSITPSADVGPSVYTGSNGYEYVMTVDGGTTYYCVSHYARRISGTASVLAWDINTADIALPADDARTDIQGLYSVADRSFTITHLDATFDKCNRSSVAPYLLADTGVASEGAPYALKGILNPVNRPVSLANYQHPDGRSMTSYQIHKTFLAGDGDNSLTGLDPPTLGANLQRPVSLLLRQLTQADIAANGGAPLNLAIGAQGGTMGGMLGSNDNLVTTAAGASPLEVFRSDNPTQKISKDTIINVSIPEFAGLKSFNGIDQQAGKNLSGEGKVLAVLPREEFETSVHNGGSLVYVAPFENWLDVNNGQELSLNQMSVEVRTINGQMASDLRPDTICQIKMRKHPDNRGAAQYERYNDRILAQASAQDTGQNVMNTIMPSTGS